MRRWKREAVQSKSETQKSNNNRGHAMCMLEQVNLLATTLLQLEARERDAAYHLWTRAAMCPTRMNGDKSDTNACDVVVVATETEGDDYWATDWAIQRTVAVAVAAAAGWRPKIRSDATRAMGGRGRGMAATACQRGGGSRGQVWGVLSVSISPCAAAVPITETSSRLL
ncbi:uncharacterized protein BKA78DRAFT_75636 [Phyllosticta capitalensis]|uniref:uncharacterized protein n=1 Tax=Phyllosticta capitalensis TaxID=121624 RepID=UPI003130467C